MRLFRFFSVRLLRSLGLSIFLAAPGLGVAIPSALSQGQGAAEAAAPTQVCGEGSDGTCSMLRTGAIPATSPPRLSACLRGNGDFLSDSCREAIAASPRGQRPPGRSPREALPRGARVIRDIAYGSDPAQRFDVYRPGDADKAPVIVMLHGGGWAFGSKAAAGVVSNKVRYFVPKGYLFISVGTRLLPQADPLQQAADLAQAMAMIEEKAASFGGDPGRVVLIGHSAGAHLAALVSADPSYAKAAGVKPWLATIALDSAAYDIAPIMRGMVVPKIYRDAFGSDPDLWEKASPTRMISGRVPKMLLVCSSFRRWSCRQAETFSRRTRGQGNVLPVDLKHRQINVQLGADNDYTQRVDGFLQSLGLP